MFFQNQAIDRERIERKNGKRNQGESLSYPEGGKKEEKIETLQEKIVRGKKINIPV